MYTTQMMDSVQIANKIGCSSSGVERLLKRNGITPCYTPNGVRVTSEDIDNMRKMYEDNKTLNEIGQVYNVCGTTISKILKKNGTNIRQGKRFSPVQNHDYFHNIDTPSKAYFLGWMITDGSVVVSKTRDNRSPVISLELQDGDRYIIEKFANELGASKDIVRNNEKRGHSYMRFSSKEMAEDLATYGVVPNKTWITYLPILDSELMPHLIRGIFDGNGTVTKDKNGYLKFAFYGSEQLCVGIRDYLNKTIGLNYNKVSKSTCYHIWWSGKTASAALFYYMYQNCDDFYLTRKFNKFKSNI